MKLFGKKFFAYLMVALIVLTSIPMTVFADGEIAPDDVIITDTALVHPTGVMVRHYDVTAIPGLGQAGADGDQWSEESLDTPFKSLYFKSAKPGTQNNLQEDDTYAFVNAWSAPGASNKDAQKIFGYITPDKNMSSLTVRTDDGARLYVDSDQNGVLELVLDEYHNQGITNYPVAVTLEKGKTYRFELQYYNWGGGGALALLDGSNNLPESYFSVDPKPQVTEDDENNVITGLNGMMEVKIGDGNWTPYTSEFINDFPNRHTVQVRYAAAYDENGEEILKKVLPNEGQIVTLEFYKQIEVTLDPVINVLKDGVYVDPTTSFIETPSAGKVVFTSGTYRHESNGPATTKTLIDGDVVSVEAIPAIGYEFDKWGADYVPGNPQQTNPRNVTISDEKTSIMPNAVFKAMPSHTVTFMAKDKVVKTEVVQYGADATAPTVSNTLEEDFTGWDKKFTGVKEDLVVNATWKVVANFWITVDDWHDLYVNGVLVTAHAGPRSPNYDGKWETVDRHLVALNLDPNKSNVIAVKAMDQNVGKATVSGFKSILKLANGEFKVTNATDWKYSLAPELKDVYGLDWFKANYAPATSTGAAAWLVPTVIEKWSTWPADDKFPTLPVGTVAQWLWSPDYKVIGEDKQFDSPVYFRMVIGEDKFKVSFMGKDAAGNEVKLQDDQMVVYGQGATEPTTITRKEGQEFVKWNKTFDRIIEDTVVTAEYRDLYFDVTFKDGDKSLKVQNVIWDGNATPPAESALTVPFGKKFAGWEGNYTNVKANEVVTAKYVDIADYEVLFYTYFDNMQPSPFWEKEFAKPGFPVHEMPNIPSRDGYRFLGWYTMHEHDTMQPASTEMMAITDMQKYMGVAFDAKTPVMYDDLNVYGNWMPQYTVTFNSNGGSAVTEITRDVMQAIGTPLPQPTRPGYSFVNWTYVTEGESGSVTKTLLGTELDFVDDFTATANWTLNPVDDEERPTRTVVIPETPAPQAAPTPATAPATEAVVDVPTTVVPLDVVTLPKTGEIPATLFYGLGGLLGGIGVFMRRKK